VFNLIPVPFSHTISKQTNTVQVVADGPINLQSSIAAMLAVANDPDFNPSFKVIVELRLMEYAPTMTELFGIRDALESLRQNFKGQITLLVTESVLYVARLVCIIATTMGFQMTATTSPDVP
jgi:hypothetical protein